MGRHSEVKFYASKNGHFTHYKGKLHRLSSCKEDDRPDGPNYLEALEEFRRVIENAERPAVDDDRVSAVVNRWLEHIQTVAPKSHKCCRSQTAPFASWCGPMRIRQLKSFHVTNWLESMRTWGSCTKWSSLYKLKQATGYNKRMGYTPCDPLSELSCPSAYQATARGAEYVLPAQLSDLLIKSAEQPLKDYLLILAKTGARPGELSHAEHYHYRRDCHALIFEANPRKGYVHKTARRKRRGDTNRTIYLDDECEDIIARNAKARGWLLPGISGERYVDCTIRRHFDRLRHHPAVAQWLLCQEHEPYRVILYSFRHTFITNAILRGVPIKTVADLCGTSVTMIEKHYSHATADRAAMRKAYLSCL